MKKRILSLMLVLALCITLIPGKVTQAAITNSNTKAEATATEVTESTAAPYSAWAQNDLIVGDTYGIYPQSWYISGMKKPIRQGQLRALFAGLRIKIQNSGEVTAIHDNKLKLNDDLTVENTLDAFYTVISNYDYTEDIGLQKKDTAVDFMTEHGIFKGTAGELGLKDKCTVEQACVFGIRLVTYIYDVLDAGSKGFLWEVKSGENTVYMLGSIHMASFGIYPFSKTLLDAYLSSDALAVELNAFNTADAIAASQLGVYSDGTTLKDHVSEATYKKTIELAASMGYPEEQIAMLKPWYIYTSFSSLISTDSGSVEEASMAASLGIDMNFTMNALIYGKPVLEVEGYDFQLKVIDSFSAELEEYLLNETIDTLNDVQAGTDDDNKESLDQMLEFWKSGDAEAFKKYTSPEYEFPELSDPETTAEEKAYIAEFQKKLITNRDKGMADYIDNLLKAEGSSTYFVIVGSGHYISDYSVLDRLTEKGYVISQIK